MHDLAVDDDQPGAGRGELIGQLALIGTVQQLQIRSLTHLNRCQLILETQDARSVDRRSHDRLGWGQMESSAPQGDHKRHRRRRRRPGVVVGGNRQCSTGIDQLADRRITIIEMKSAGGQCDCNCVTLGQALDRKSVV